MDDGGTPFETDCDDEPCEVFKLCLLLLLLLRGRECERGRDFERERERARDPALLDGRDRVVA